MTVEVAEQIKSADAPVVRELKSAPVMAITPAGEEVQLAAVVTAPPADQPMPAAVAAALPDQLPETAGTLPLLGLIGLMLLGAGFGIRAVRSRV